MKYVVVVGGTLSGLGKGITASSIGNILRSSGWNITSIKIDPYLNIDAGTMNPLEHGEVFVLDDGGEVDLDLGNYERFLDITLMSDHNITTGKVYQSVIDKERRGDYLGHTVQIIPHITDEIKRRIYEVSSKSNADITVIEVGGTVGDIESGPFLEAIRQMQMELGEENMVIVHTTFVPVVGAVGEQKTKPTQHSVKELLNIGLKPSFIVCRGPERILEKTRNKISLFCNVPNDHVFSAEDLDLIYKVPLHLHSQGIGKAIQKALHLPIRASDMKEWEKFVENYTSAKREITIGLVGKYTLLKDSYLSIFKSIEHASSALNTVSSVRIINSRNLTEDNLDQLKGLDAIIVPGGFGVDGSEGKILAINYARENGIPFQGICFGFQLAVIEFCRNVLGWKDSSSSEFENGGKPVVSLMEEQKGLEYLGGTMRKGAYDVIIKPGTLASKLYGKEKISERHRHRYEVTYDLVRYMEEKGLMFSGRSPDGKRMEILELKGHPFFVASQFHPEFKSRPNKPAPIFYGLVRAAVNMKYSQGDSQPAEETPIK